MQTTRCQSNKVSVLWGVSMCYVVSMLQYKIYLYERRQRQVFNINCLITCTQKSLWLWRRQKSQRRCSKCFGRPDLSFFVPQSNNLCAYRSLRKSDIPCTYLLKESCTTVMQCMYWWGAFPAPWQGNWNQRRMRNEWIVINSATWWDWQE